MTYDIHTQTVLIPYIITESAIQKAIDKHPAYASLNINQRGELSERLVPTLCTKAEILFDRSAHFRRSLQDKYKDERLVLAMWMEHWALAFLNRQAKGKRIKDYLRAYDGGLYSDLEYFTPDLFIMGDMVRKYDKTDFYSALDGITRHKIGQQWYESLDGRYTLKLSESRSENGLPEFDVFAWYNPTEQEKRFHNTSVTNLNKIEDCFSVKGIDRLNECIKRLVGLIQEDRKYKALSLEEKIQWYNKKYPKRAVG